MTTRFAAPNAGLEWIPSLSQLPLEDVALQGNRLWSLEGLPLSIKKLNASDNKLEQEGLFLPFPSLEELNVSQNRLTIFDDDDFVLCFPSLKRLDLSSNSLRHVAFLRHSVVEQLNVSQNRLTLLNGLPQTIQRIVADSNQITMIQSKLPPLLERLDVSYNSLRFAGLPLNWSSSLRELHLNSNCIEKFPRNLPEGLEILTLNKNKLKSIPNDLPSSLKVLCVASNRIQYVPRWKPNRFAFLLLDNNCLTEPVSTAVSIVVSQENNWNEPIHQNSQRKIKQCWKRCVLTLRLRQYKRTRSVKEELFMVSMQPERWMQIDVLDPVWFRKGRRHSRTDHHWD